MPSHPPADRKDRACPSPSRPLALLLLALTLAATPARARDATELSLEELAAEPVFSGSKFPQRTADVPGAISVITADDIRTHGWRSFDEVLGALRGVFVSSDRNYSYLSARGFGRPGEYNPRFLFLLDGQRLNEDVFGQAPVGRDFPLAVGMIERVEFISGPGSASYGSGAFIGTVNVVTRGAADMPGWRTLAGIGSDRLREGRASWGGQFDNGAQLLLGISAYADDGASLRFPEFDDALTPGGRVAGLDDERAHGLSARLRYGPTRVLLIANDRDKHVPTAAYRTRFGDPGLRSGDRRSQIGIDTGWDATPALRMTALAGWLSARGDGHYPYGASIGEVHQTYGNDRASAELRADWTGWAGHRLTGGVELRRDFSRVQTVENVNHGHFDDEPATSLGLYAEDGWRFDERWLLSLGARADQTSSAGRHLSPRAALIWQPGPATSVKLVASRAFRDASQFEQVFLPAAIGDTPHRLAAERIGQGELVVEHYASNNWRSQMSLYRYSADRLIGSSVTHGEATVRDDGRRRGTGTDIETEFALDDGTRLRASAAWQRSVTPMAPPAAPEPAQFMLAPLAPAAAAGADFVPNAPTRLFSLQLSRPLGLGNARIATELRGLSSRYGPLGNRVPGRMLVNVNLSALPLGRGVMLDVGAFNLFGQRHADVASADNVDSYGRQLLAVPQDGLLLRAQIRVAF